MFEPKKKKKKGGGGANFNGSNVILLLWLILKRVDLNCKEDQKLKQESLFKTLEQSQM
jgi:hypothetical protein